MALLRKRFQVGFCEPADAIVALSRRVCYPGEHIVDLNRLSCVRSTTPTTVHLGPVVLSRLEDVGMRVDRACTVPCLLSARWPHDSYLVDPASSHLLVSKIKPCMSKYKHLYCETANGSLNQLSFI